MDTVLVYVLILSSSNGSLLKVEDISSYDDCVHIRQRTIASNNNLFGVCTQFEKVIPKQQPITLHVSPSIPQKVIVINK
jgi:hypothetical protein